MTPKHWFMLLAIGDWLALGLFIWLRLLPDTLLMVFSFGLAAFCLWEWWPDLGPTFREIYDAFR